MMIHDYEESMIVQLKEWNSIINSIMKGTKIRKKLITNCLSQLVL
jgi:hypothetical protein